MVDVLAVSNSEVPTSKYEVLMAQPLPKLATATRHIYITLCFPLTEFSSSPAQKPEELLNLYRVWETAKRLYRKREDGFFFFFFGSEKYERR
jgi:hypothetical protein